MEIKAHDATFRIDEDLREPLKDLAQQSGQAVTEIMNRIVRDELRRLGLLRTAESSSPDKGPVERAVEPAQSEAKPEVP